MFNKLKEYLMSLISSRIIYLLVFYSVLFGILIYRIFDMQIIRGEDYINNFEMKQKKERFIDAARGNIYDCNGVLLAYNKLAYSVTIEDVYESGKKKNENLNKTIYKTINIIEENGDTIDIDFGIGLDEDNNYQFTLSGARLSRFKADIYGEAYVDNMTYAQASSSPDEIIEYLAGDDKFNISEMGVSKEMTLKMAAIRYAMSLNAYQKYISTVISTDVSDKTVAVIYENSNILRGVNISEDTIRVYPNGKYTAQIVGYTGKINSDELATYSLKDDSYSLNDIIGKTGIERSMESWLRGQKGSETIYVNTTGKVISSEDYVEATAGNDVYLSIDSKLQEATYNILEQKLAGILLKKIINAKEYIPRENSSASDIMIPIYDVYYSMFNNQVINIDHLSADDATDTEKEIYNAFLNKKADVLEKIKSELTDKKTPYNKLTTEYKVYENHVEDLLIDNKILLSSKIVYSDKTYKAWAVDETISLSEYINYAISQNWIDSDSLDLDEAYSQSNEIYEEIVNKIIDKLSVDKEFDRKIYKYIIKNDAIKGKQICNCLLDQGIITLSEEEKAAWDAGRISPFQFMITRIENLEITPAQLALEPYSASLVITNVNTGKVMALVSYPSYDNNYLANGADAAYLKKINSDLSKPLINYATQQRTAPGSTYKMVSATAGLCEGVINTHSLITCTGSFEVTTDTHKCWVWPGSHGALNVSGAINKSCNVFFYNVGYKLSLDDKGMYSSDLGVEKLNKYADLYGLSEKSGVEIEEYNPILTEAFSVPSAIGQGTNSFTTVGLARYVTSVANGGTVYNLSLLDKITDREGNLIKECSAEVRNTIEMDEAYWNAIHDGMRRVVTDMSYYSELPVTVAGKTGTAQQSKTSPDHGLFVCYAPYEKPEIAIASRISNGYSSSYVAYTVEDVLKYYFNVDKEDNIVTGSAEAIGISAGHGD